MRIYNPSLGRFLSVDPLSKDYPWYTPYQFTGNKPIFAVDLDGLEEFAVIRWYDNNGKFSGSTTFVVPDNQRIQDNGTLIVNQSINNKPPENEQYLNSLTGLLYTTNKAGERTLSGGKILDQSNNSWERETAEKAKKENKIVETKYKDKIIYFEDPSNVTTPTNPDRYAVFQKTLKNNPEFKLEIEGNASKNDKVSEDVNQRLSENRAETIKREILKGGAKSEQITTKGNGSKNASTDGNPNDRNAVIKINLPRDAKYD
jgi:outer membrane protein OmpA-like peptidoglycan-associated protein